MQRRKVHGGRFVTVLAVVASAGVFSAGSAHADPYAGRTYADASERISNSGRTPVVATVTGDQLPLDECIVESSSPSNFLDGTSGSGPSWETLLNLNCTYAYAQPGKPGNSVASPEGREAKARFVADQKLVGQLNEIGGTWCFNSDSNYRRCVRACDSTGACEFEL